MGEHCGAVHSEALRQYDNSGAAFVGREQLSNNVGRQATLNLEGAGRTAALRSLTIERAFATLGTVLGREVLELV